MEKITSFHPKAKGIFLGFQMKAKESMKDYIIMINNNIIKAQTQRQEENREELQNASVIRTRT